MIYLHPPYVLDGILKKKKIYFDLIRYIFYSQIFKHSWLSIITYLQVLQELRFGFCFILLKE
jgi:hypothetical protein